LKIYTKTGDQGKTALVSGRRLAKSAALIEAYGSVDELNSFVGALVTEVSDTAVLNDLRYIQHILFNIGSLLAQDGADFPDYPDLQDIDVSYLEGRMDAYDQSLSKMTAFIIPGGSKSISYAHICRTITRRAERRVVDLEELAQTELIMRYLNRLSDYFFILARYLHYLEDIEETKWDNDIRSSIDPAK